MLFYNKRHVFHLIKILKIADSFRYFIFYTEAFLFIFYFIICSITIILNRIYFTNLVHKDTVQRNLEKTIASENITESTTSSNYTYCFEESETGTSLNTECKCAFLHPTDDLRYVIVHYFFCFFFRFPIDFF